MVESKKPHCLYFGNSITKPIRIYKLLSYKCLTKCKIRNVCNSTNYLKVTYVKLYKHKKCININNQN